MGAASIVRLCLLACIWGSSFLLIEVALRGLSPTQIVLGRLVGASVTLLAVVAFRGHPLPREPITWLHLGVMGLVANIGSFFLMSWAQQTIPSGVAGVLNGTTPLFTVAFAVASLAEERLSRLRAAGLLLGFVGVVVVLAPWDQALLSGSVVGHLAGLAAAAGYGATFVYTRRFITQRPYPSVSLAAGQLVVAAALFALAAPFVAADEVTLTPAVVGSVVALGVLGTGVAYLFYYRLITDAGATSTSMVNYLAPVVAVALGVIVLDEPLGWNLFVGAGVVIAGIAVAEGRLAGRRRSPSPQPATPEEAP